MIMIVSLRSPTRPDSASPNAGAYGELGSMQAPLSAPVSRKFDADGSAGGNVSDVDVAGVVAAVSPGASVAAGPSVVVVVVDAAAAAAGFVMLTTSRLRTTM